MGSIHITPSGHVKAVLLLASTMTVMSGAIIAPALPGISRHFADEPHVTIQLILTLPALMITLFSPAVGYLADRFGRKNLLLLALLTYGMAGFGGFLLDRVDLLLGSRGLLGIAVAGIVSLSTTLIGDFFSGMERARFLGMQSSVMALAGVFFINIGGALSEWSWRGPFLLYLTGILLLPYAWAILKEPQHHQVVAGTENNSPDSVDYWRTALAYLTVMTGMAMFYMFPAQLPFLLSRETEASGFAIGIALSATALTAAVVGFLYGHIKRFFSVITIYVLGFFVSAAGFFVVGLTESYLMVVFGAALSGLGLGLFAPNTTVWLMRISPERVRGRVFGGFSSAFFFGQFVSPLAVAPVALWSGSLRNAFVLTAILCCLLAGALAVLGMTALQADREL